MVRTVHRNILYSVDWGICGSKRGFGTKSQNQYFQKCRLKIRNWWFWDSKWGLLGGSRDGNCSQIYPGLIRHHPGSIFIHKTIFLKENHPKSRCSKGMKCAPKQKKTAAEGRENWACEPSVALDPNGKGVYLGNVLNQLHRALLSWFKAHCCAWGNIKPEAEGGLAVKN